MLVMFTILAASLLLHHLGVLSTVSEIELKGTVEEASPGDERLHKLLGEADAIHQRETQIPPPWFHHPERIASATWLKHLVYVDEDGQTLKGFVEHGTTSNVRGVKHFYSNYSWGDGGGHDYNNDERVRFEFVRDAFAVGEHAGAIQRHLMAELYAREHQREMKLRKEHPNLPSHEKLYGVGTLHNFYLGELPNAFTLKEEGAKAGFEEAWSKSGGKERQVINLYDFNASVDLLVFP